MRWSAARLIAAIAAVLGVTAATGLAQVVVVPTFEVGRGTFGGHLQDVDVAAAPEGGFLAIWGDYRLGGSDNDDHAALRRFSAQGVALGPPFLADTSGHVFDPHVSPLPNGGYVAAWQWIARHG